MSHTQLSGKITNAGRGRSVCLVSDSSAEAIPSAAQLAKLLTADGWQTTLLDLTVYAAPRFQPLNHPDNEKKKARQYAYEKLRGQFRENNWYIPVQSLCTYNWLRERNFDLIVFQHGFGAAWFACQARKLGLAFPETPIVVAADGTRMRWLEQANCLPPSPRTDFEIDYFERQSVATADAVLSTDPECLAWMQGAGWNAPKVAGVLGGDSGEPWGKWLRGLGRKRQEAKAPFFSVCLEGADTQEAVDALKVQTSKNFEIVAGPDKAKGDYLLFLDGHGILLPDAIAVLATAAAHGADALTMPQGIDPRYDIHPRACAYLPPRSKNEQRRLPVNWLFYGGDLLLNSFLNLLGAGEFCVRRDAYKELSGANPGLSKAALLLKALGEGRRIECVPEVIALSKKRYAVAPFDVQKDELRIIAQHLPEAMRPLLLAARGPLNGIRAHPGRYPAASCATKRHPLFAGKPAGDTPAFVICPDDNYVLQASVVIASICSAHAKRVDIYIISALRPENIKRLQAIAQHFGQTLNFVACRSELDVKVAARPLHGNRSMSMYTRVFIPDYLSDLKRVIYLDCDVIVRSAVDELWHSDLEDCPVGAVADPFFIFETQFLEQFGGDQFNSGMLLMDLENWRADKVTDQAVKWIKHFDARPSAIHYRDPANPQNPPLGWPDTLHYWDQSSLNMALKGRWKALAPKWNFNERARPHHMPHYCMDPGQYDGLKNNPAIYHFMGEEKPWLPQYSGHAFAQEYNLLAKLVQSLWDH
ncbi:MAG: hypothetical protein GC131_01620 [Alphaproteobacteria bacterium]|nr:hypothetical protein [Alphaproteobacteria bacterium]